MDEHKAMGQTAQTSIETDQASAETLRKPAETARPFAETARPFAEMARPFAETARPTAETNRTSKRKAGTGRKSLPGATRLLEHNDQRFFLMGGLAFLIAASFLTLKELALGVGFTLGAITLIASFTSQTSHRGRLRLVSTGAVLGTCLLSTGVYVVGLDGLSPGFFLAPTVMLLCAFSWIYRLEMRDRIGASSAGAEQTPTPDRENNDRLMLYLSWTSLTLALVILSWSLYFQFVTSQLSPEFHLRRLVLTGGWTLFGMAFYFRGRIRRHVCLMLSGTLFLMMAIFKAAFYDTMYLDGYARIATLAFMGITLTVASLYLKNRFKLQPQLAL